MYKYYRDNYQDDIMKEVIKNHNKYPFDIILYYLM